ncbi:MAG: tyrosine-type recombinase/integrase [Planctomycetota bacterium]|jgi:integrase
MAVTRKKLPGLLYDKTRGWWFSNIKDPAKKCGRAKHMWSNNKAQARRLYKENIVRVVSEHANHRSEVVSIPVEDNDTWSLIEMAAHYYDFKLSDGCSAHFLASIKRYIQRFFDWLRGQKFDVKKNSAKDLTSKLLGAYRQYLAEDTSIGLRTANHCIEHVRMLLLWGVKIHGIGHPPIGSIRRFSTRRNVKQGHGRRQNRRPLSWSELEKLLSAANVTDAALVMLGLNCGFGNSDIGTLKIRDVNFEKGTVSHPRPKTGIARDFILWPETVRILKEYLSKYRGKPKNDDIATRFFIGRKGYPLCWERLKPDGKIQRSDAVNIRFDRLCTKAGINRDYGMGFYILRHTYATLIGSESKDFREVQAALGQVTIQQQEVYRHDRAIKAKQAQERLRGQMHGTAIREILLDKLGNGCKLRFDPNALRSQE